MYLVRLLDRNGQSFLQNGKNNYYLFVMKKKTINKVLIEYQSVEKIAILCGFIIDRIYLNILLEVFRQKGPFIITHAIRSTKAKKRCHHESNHRHLLLL